MNQDVPMRKKIELVAIKIGKNIPITLTDVFSYLSQRIQFQTTMDLDWFV